MPEKYQLSFLKKGMIFIILSLFSCCLLHAQERVQAKNQNREELSRFAIQKSTEWLINKRKADSLAIAQNLPVYYKDSDSIKIVILQGLGPKNQPIYYATDNIIAAKTISVDKVWSINNEYPMLSGDGIEINLWDGGTVLTSHQEFQNETEMRIVMRDLGLPLSNHSTHIAGTMIATGINPDAKGMAGKAIIKAWDLKDDIAEMSGEAADGILLSNHSYGPFCGWTYNSSNESWYWYGDPEISETEDYEFGFYNQTSADLDYIAHLAPDYLMVKSAGNDRNDGPISTLSHYVWDEKWVLVKVAREPDGGTDGFDCLTPMAVAKNILTVGAVDDAKAMTAFSSYGPTDDGRIKPDVVANGSDVVSCTSESDNAYNSFSGTSMATASATGSVALLHQLQNTLQPGVTLHASTIKGILIHTAADLGNTGPDYRFGWGLLDIKAAADIIYDNSNNQGKNIYEEVLSQGEEIIIPVSTSDLFPFLKVTLSWTDPAGQPSSPSLNPRTSKLVNDLDVSVKNTSSLKNYLPWLLNVENPDALATKNINHVDNIEQVYIANPGNSNFNIKISHSGTLSGGSQAFSLIISGIKTIPNIFPPQNLAYSINETNILLNWNKPALGTPNSYKIYRNGTLLKETTNLFYTDQSVVLDKVYEYYITAVYIVNNQKLESVPTNKISVYPQTLRTLPFIVDFEKEPTEVSIQNDEFGWLWGNSETLSSYYLNYSTNTTNFIGIDSYTNGKYVHISDVAYTAPLRLADYTNVVLSFDYLLKSGIYDAIDEMHIVYKLQEEKDWNELYNLEIFFKWNFKSIELPPEICKNGTQIGFYYDDFDQWGMGAGLDNIVITGEPIQTEQRCIDLQFVTGWNIFSVNNSPFSTDMLEIFQPLIENGSLIKIQDELGNSVEDWNIYGDWQNHIDDISPAEGYKVKVNNNATLPICGLPVKYPFPISLNTGWNIAGFPQQTIYNAMNIFQQLIDSGSLVKVQDENGNSIENLGIFGGWINNIGDLVPGEGYKICVNKNDVLWIYESYSKTSTIKQTVVDTKYFLPMFDGNGLDHMNINLVELPEHELNAGDEIAVFDDTCCVGATVVTDQHLQNNLIPLVASANDNLVKNGFTEGNPMVLKLWSASKNKETVLNPEIKKGPLVFTKHGTTIASIEKYTSTRFKSSLGSDIAEINCYPNPFSREMTIEIKLKTLADVQVELINQMGQILKTVIDKQKLQGDFYRFKWNLENTEYTHISPGVYFLRFTINDTKLNHKIILTK